MTLACPVCRSVLNACEERVDCPSCHHRWLRRDGIWRMIRPERLPAIESFLRDYTAIRLAEGRGSNEPSFFQSLPACPPDHPMAWQWSIRRGTFRCLVSRVLPALGNKLKIADLGAGTGWLSNRLAALGHEPCAIDLSCDEQDGLAAARHFSPAWPRVQAEFDRLPLPDSTADIVLFNASLHYSTDYAHTLREALRALIPGGHIVILESPVYRKDSSGRQMREERHAAFLKRYGTRSDSVPSLEYLTWTGLAELGAALGVEWKIFRPWYGIRWALRPWIAKWKGRREPSRFVILTAQKL